MIISDYKNYRKPLNFFPEIEPYEFGYIEVDDIHKVYYEVSGNSQGTPILFIHGGPGGATYPKHRQFFDPAHYKIILFDQRGCGKSKPLGEVKNNNTEFLIEDIERIRSKLNINKWHIFGGSWGSTLALCYAIANADKVLSLTLRGIFLMRDEEINWLSKGVKNIFPAAYAELISILSADEQKDIMQSFYNRINSADDNIRIEASLAWSKYESSASKLLPDTENNEEINEDFINSAYSVAKLELHYMLKNKFKSDNFILENVNKIKQIPMKIVQGRYDIVCPIKTAYDLHNALPESEFIIVPDAGHSASEIGIVHELIKATNQLKNIKC